MSLTASPIGRRFGRAAPALADHALAGHDQTPGETAGQAVPSDLSRFLVTFAGGFVFFSVLLL